MRKYQGSNRLVYIDSWFQSVKTTTALKRMGIDSIGVVKTAHKNYPRERLDRICANAGPSSVAAASHTTDDGLKVIAIQWQQNRHHKVTYCGTAGSARIVDEPFVSSTGKHYEQPEIAQKYQRNFGKVDQFNHRKVGKGKNGFEHVLKTTNRPNFPLFTGILSMIMTNMFLAALYFFPTVFSDMSRNDFLAKMAHVLINNMYLRDDADVRASRKRARLQLHHSLGFRVKKTNCKVCYVPGVNGGRPTKKSTLGYCTKCDIAVCTPTSANGATCWNRHNAEE